MISKEKDFQEFFPVWNKLTAGQQEQLEHAVRYEHAKKGTIIHNGSLTVLAFCSFIPASCAPI